jgi:N4-gp56 family major capsid protein
MSSTTATLTGLMQTFYDKKFLERAKEMQTYDVGAQVRSIPSNGGKVVYFTRFSALAKATTALTEATNPSFVDMSTTTVSATVAEYGSAVKVGKLFELTSIDTGLAEHVDVIAQNAGETVDELILAALDDNGTTLVANNVALTAVAASDTLDGAEIRRAVRTLKLNKAPKFEDGTYKCIIPVSVVHDLRGDSEWLDAHRYVGNAEAIRNGEIGMLHGVKFYETNNEQVDADAGAGSVDVYSTFVFGKEAYGIVDIAGTSSPKVYVKNPNGGSTDNPIDMYSTIGWKVHFAAKVLNSDWLVQIKSASSVGDNA